MLLCTVALAGQKDGFQLGPNLGYTFGGGVESPSLTYGLQAAYQFKYFRIELAYDRLKDDATESEEGVSMSMKLKANAISLSGWGRLPVTDKFGLYAGGGLNYYMPSMDTDATVNGRDLAGAGVKVDVDVDNAFGFQVGVGAEYAITDQIAVFADVRKVWVKLDTDLTATMILNGLSVTESVSDKMEWYFTMARIGVNYTF